MRTPTSSQPDTSRAAATLLSSTSESRAADTHYLQLQEQQVPHCPQIQERQQRPRCLQFQKQ